MHATPRATPRQQASFATREQASQFFSAALRTGLDPWAPCPVAHGIGAGAPPCTWEVSYVPAKAQPN